MFWQYNFLVCSWRADVAVVSFNTPSRENTKYGDGFHPSVSPDAEAVIVAPTRMDDQRDQSRR